MRNRNRLAAWLLVLPLAMLPAACGDRGDERAALRDDELNRELELAFQGDSTPVAFDDAAMGAEPEPEPGPAPRVDPPAAPQRDPAPVPRPAPAREPSPPPVRQPVPAPAPEPAPQPAPQPRAVTASAAIGTSMSLTLNQTLSTETNRVGDSFTATLQHAITDGTGNVVVPAGATIRGRLTQVEKSGHVGATGIIKLAFESVSFGGSSYPLDATVVRANPQRQNRTSTAEQAAKIGAGAAAGAILGRVLGGSTRSTVQGAAVGAAAGTAIAMGTADVDVVLPQGSEMVIRLDSPIEVRRTIY
ncbi:MAG TPA: hypothetical protein VK929_08180 [Longimicrobiales bacterium]|nr:hypothetical protein [Longimicrobiales bacterium]